MGFVKGYKQTKEHIEKLKISRKRTHCKRGHEFTEENTYTYPNGDRGCKICRFKSSREAFLNRTLQQKNNVLDKELCYKYGIGLQEYNKLFEEQNGCCGICGKHQTEFKRRLYVDHCHDTGRVRGLLCTICNTSLGGFKDNIDILESAIKYLKNKKQNEHM